MNHKTDIIKIGACLLLVGMLSISCNRLKNAIESPSLSILASNQLAYGDSTLVVGQTITLNANIVNFPYSIDRITWTSSKGRLNTSSGNIVVYTAPDEACSVTIQVVASGNSGITTTANLLFSVIIPDIPLTPQNIQAVATDNAIMITWDSAKPSLDGGYRIFYSDSPTGGFTGYKYNVDVGKKNSFTLTTLSNNIKYYFAILAYDTSSLKQESPLSNPPMYQIPKDTVKPCSPTQFNITVNADHYFILNWVMPADADLAGVIVRRSTAGFPTINDGLEVCSGNITSFVDTTVVPGIEYFYSIFAYDEVPLYSDPATRTKIYVP